MRHMSASIVGVSTRDAFGGILAETLFCVPLDSLLG